MRDNKKNGIANDFPNINYMVMWWSCVQFQSAKRSAAILLNQAKSAPLTVFLHLFVSPRRFMIHYVQSQHTHTKQYKNGPFVSVVCSHNSPFSIQTNVKCFVADLYIYIFCCCCAFLFYLLHQKDWPRRIKKNHCKKQNRKKLKRKKMIQMNAKLGDKR